MSLRNRVLIGAASCACVAAFVTGLAVGQNKDAKAPTPTAGKPPEMQLPKGWTPEDMQACMLAGTPGKEHAALLKSVGTWVGTNQMWMAPDSESMTTETTWTISNFMDGRYAKTDVSGDMPGMGPFAGMGIAGYDNAAKQYVSDWVDNHGTGIMRGTGVVSDDGKTMTWTYSYMCPIQKKLTTMREVVKHPTDTTMTVDMFSTDPKTGKEFKCMQMEMKRKS